MSSSETKELSASLEDYLEAMLMVLLEKKAVRAKDIASRLNVSRPSVTGALQTLASKKYINYAPYDVITLTPEGEELANKVLSKHTILTHFFRDILLVDPTEAEETACKMEHTVSEEIVKKIQLLSSYLQEDHSQKTDWSDQLVLFCKNKKKRK